MKRVFLLGYSNHRPEEIRKLAENLDATVFDIRFKPFSRDARFTVPALRSLFGARYCLLRDFGNPLYRSDQLAIADFDAGLRVLRRVENDNVILMCACKSATSCHRTLVGSKLASCGFKVIEVDETASPADPILDFGDATANSSNPNASGGGTR